MVLVAAVSIYVQYLTRQGHKINIQRKPCHMIPHAHQVICIIMHIECCAMEYYARLFAGTLAVSRYAGGAFHFPLATLYTYIKGFPPVP